MIAPASLPAVHMVDERTVKLDQYVERLTRYLTPALTDKLFADPDVNDFQINSDGRVWLDRHSVGRVHEGRPHVHRRAHGLPQGRGRQGRQGLSRGTVGSVA